MAIREFWMAKKTKELETKFPVSMLETGRDIVFFWVIRMMLVSLAHMEEIPMREVLLHGMVLDAKGQKMSKSKGNVISIDELLGKYGPDIVRYGLLSRSVPGKDIRLDEAVFQNVYSLVERLQHMLNEILNLSSCNDSIIGHDLVDWLWGKVHELYHWMVSGMENYNFQSLLQEVTQLLHQVIKWTRACIDSNYSINQSELRCAISALLMLLEPFLPELYKKNIKIIQETEIITLESILEVTPKVSHFQSDTAERIEKLLNQLAKEIGQGKSRGVYCSFNLNIEKNRMFELYGKAIVCNTPFQFASHNVNGTVLRYEAEPGIEILLITEQSEYFTPLDKFFRSEIRNLNRELKGINDRLKSKNFFLMHH
ncbi:class I tRNA ligase family protein [Bacillus pacificus]|nr:class I tRNA ligase family protein [Bacillus pacificus]